jgi:hypothetical protein
MLPLPAATTSQPQQHKGHYQLPQSTHHHLQAAGSKRDWEIFSGPNRILSCWSHTWQKTKTKRRNKILKP